MNPSLSPVQGLGGKMDVGIMLALPGYVPKQITVPPCPPMPADPIPVSTAVVVQSVVAELNELIIQVISKTSAEEFDAAKTRVFPRYFEAAWGLSLLLAAFV